MSFDVLFNQFMSGIARSALLFLVASGLSLTFGVLRVLNFAHGSIFMLGAFVAYTIWKYLLIPTVGFYIASVLAALVMAGLGLIIELLLLRRLYSRGWPEQLLATYAIVLMITDLVKWQWGGEFLSILQFRHHYSGVDRGPLSLVVSLSNPARRYHPGCCP